MTQPVPPDVLRKIRKLAQLPDEARHCRIAVSITRLTVLKSLCQEPDVTNRFVTYLARRTRQKVKEKANPPDYHAKEDWGRQRTMIDRAVKELERYLDQPSEEGRARLRTLFHEPVEEQNEHRRIHGGPVRIITNTDLLLVEYALHTVLADKDSAPLWAYQTARHYAERYDPSYGTGLTPASAPLVQDIVDFWLQEFGLDPATLTAPVKANKRRTEKPSSAKTAKSPVSRRKKVQFTPRQGQFLAFIHQYCKLHRQGPGELDMVQYFRVTPPSVHDMVVRLEELGLVTRERGVPRSVRVAIPEQDIPPLEDVEAPPW